MSDVVENPSRDRPAADEIEVTPEIIESGYKAACLHDREDAKEWEIAAVYRAMEYVRRAGHGTGSSSGNT